MNHVFVCNQSQHVDYARAHLDALRMLDFKAVVFHANCWTRGAIPIGPQGNPHYEFTSPGPVMLAATDTLAHGLTPCLYVHPHNWAARGGDTLSLVAFVKLFPSWGVFLDGVEIDNDEYRQLSLTRQLRAVCPVVIAHVSFPYDLRNDYPPCVDCCTHTLIGEQPTFADVDDPKLRGAIRPWQASMVKWPSNHTYSLQEPGYAKLWIPKWVNMGGSMWCDPGPKLQAIAGMTNLQVVNDPRT